MIHRYTMLFNFNYHSRWRMCCYSMSSTDKFDIVVDVSNRESGQFVLVSPEGLLMGGFKCNEGVHSEAYMMDLTWASVRMTPLKLFEVHIFH